METVYIETSIPSYLIARPSRSLTAAARQQQTVEWWDTQRVKYQLFISNVVIAEASQGDPKRAQERLEVIRSVARLSITHECQELARQLVRDCPLPECAQDDALHVAIASFHGMDFLLTWNCRHLANAHLVPRLRRVVESSGYRFPQICTPEELMGG